MISLLTGHPPVDPLDRGSTTVKIKETQSQEMGTLLTQPDLLGKVETLRHWNTVRSMRHCILHVVCDIPKGEDSHVTWRVTYSYIWGLGLSQHKLNIDASNTKNRSMVLKKFKDKGVYNLDFYYGYLKNFTVSSITTSFGTYPWGPRGITQSSRPQILRSKTPDY